MQIIKFDSNINIIRNGYVVGSRITDGVILVKGSYDLGGLEEGCRKWVRDARENKCDIPIILKCNDGEIIDSSNGMPEIKGLMEKVLVEELASAG